MRNWLAMCAVVLFAIGMFGVTTPSAAAAETVTGTWHGQSPNNGKWYTGSWRLVINGSQATMYFNGNGSACNGEAISLSVTGSGNTLTMSGRGCKNARFNFNITRGAGSVRLGSKYNGRAEGLTWS